MKYQLKKYRDVIKKEKFDIHIDVYTDLDDCGFVIIDTKTGHNQEFYDKKSTFNYIVLKGSGSFFLDDEEVKVEKGDFISISPKTRIYYKGEMKLVLITNPAWKAENEVETRDKIW